MDTEFKSFCLHRVRVSFLLSLDVLYIGRMSFKNENPGLPTNCFFRVDLGFVKKSGYSVRDCECVESSRRVPRLVKSFLL